MKITKLKIIITYIFIIIGILLIIFPLIINIQNSNVLNLLLGLGVSFFVLGISLTLPNRVLNIIKRTFLPLFIREETTFPHPRFFEIIEKEAIAIEQIDIFAHFHAHWLGITNPKNDTTGYHGRFYDILFNKLVIAHYKNRKRTISKNRLPILNILFLDYSSCGREVRENVADLLGIGIRFKKGSKKSNEIQKWSKAAVTQFKTMYDPLIKALIEEKILNNNSKIKWADFIPTMGIIRIKYTDNIGKNSWIQAELLTHAINKNNKVGGNRFTIMFQGVNKFGLKDSRIELFDKIIRGEWEKAKIFP